MSIVEISVSLQTYIKLMIKVFLVDNLILKLILPTLRYPIETRQDKV